MSPRVPIAPSIIHIQGSRRARRLSTAVSVRRLYQYSSYTLVLVTRVNAQVKSIYVPLACVEVCSRGPDRVRSAPPEFDAKPTLSQKS
jgi:hypothetical protein